jgi:hypothetical protein
MGLMQKLFGGAEAQPLPPPSPPKRARTSPPSAETDGAPVLPAAGMRRELLRLALRQSLMGNGIPSSWIVAETLEVGSRGSGTPGIHIRLVLQHWEPRLLPYTLAFQHDLEQRLLAVEPQAGAWLRGFSWQYAGATGEPGPMPDPASWGDDAQPEGAPVAMEPPQPGPPRKSKEELALLFAQQDRGRPRQDERPDFAPTQPVTW